MQIGEAGLYRLSIPQSYGGLWDGNTISLSEASMEVICQLCTGEGSTGMIFAMSSGMLRLCLDFTGLVRYYEERIRAA